jgi:ribonuclease HI
LYFSGESYAQNKTRTPTLDQVFKVYQSRFMNWPKEVIIYTDGASRGNPGPAALGVYCVSNNGDVLAEIAEPLGVQTNNYAEYVAVIRALEVAIEKKVETLYLRSDSQLMVRQILGEYKVKAPGIIPLHGRCKALISKIPKVYFEHVRREFNREADRLANQALDRG